MRSTCRQYLSATAFIDTEPLQAVTFVTFSGIDRKSREVRWGRLDSLLVVCGGFLLLDEIRGHFANMSSYEFFGHGDAHRLQQLSIARTHFASPNPIAVVLERPPQHAGLPNVLTGGPEVD